MQSHGHQSYASPVAEEVKKVPRESLLKICVIVVLMMLIMAIISLSIGLWSDGLWSVSYGATLIRRHA